MPERTRSGTLSRSRRRTATTMQSVGVPSMANRCGATSRAHSGGRVVSEWLAPLCSCSGATTQTSEVISRAIFSSSLMPGDSMPSSFAIRIRHLSGIDRSAMRRLDGFLSAHIGLQRLGNRDGAVVALKVLQNRDQCAPDREGGAVQRVNVREAFRETFAFLAVPR